MQSRWNLVETLLSKMQIHLMMLTQRQYKAHDGGKRRADSPIGAMFQDARHQTIMIQKWRTAAIPAFGA